ncbi:zincin-like metallopeptidase domain-containing protein [Bacteroides xylanisolvens]|uniref:zincin-like metallopeptidase domain-containing protein n=1 Tax=Bacteroides xylanisolvens TaxID=371601 RepID=UPI00230748AE|nr:zincin-like metallopeptidase domain-containing protein [Bacteroides xylanisolvens]MDB0689335.1 zincin-like metallopeptidase domain-containing protein [Bacteroides xylanisolvens]MDB0693331.1 zincin-like metallopeptidase domain-containing protein [Bacteroides xylanisolvens]MDB0703949.1 zincin-like metallopeptidase domain-containing protein [Bacteroides xylanisolvens]
MAEENINKKTGAERQAEVLVAALERANKNGGTLLNAWQKAMPQFYDKTLRITPVNALIMAMHSDNGEFKTNSYTMFNETHDRSEAVKKGQKGVPFVWQNLNQYVNKDNAEDKISRAEYNSLADAEKAKYKVNPREDVYTVFNIDQTTMSHVHKEEYAKQVEQFGPNRPTDEKLLRMDVNKFIQSMKDNLVPIRKDATGIAHYDSKKDTLHIPAQKDFPSYADYVQEVTRQIVHATGVPQRLGREGHSIDGVKTPSEVQQHMEMLVKELASAHRMLELGMTAKMRPQTVEQLPNIISELKADPTMAQKVLHDVNRTVGMIKKAENGEKIKLIEKPSEKRQQAWASQFPIDKVPSTFTQISMLKDDEGKWTLAAKPENAHTFAVHPNREDVSLYFDMMKNDHDETHVNEFKTQFAQKYYSVVAANPEKEANIFRSNASQDALDLISKVNAFKTKDNKILLVATIGDEKQKSVQINQSQWQRMWLADDKQDYKTHLAAILYSDVLAGKLEEMKRSISPDVEGTQLHEENEHREYHEEEKQQQQQMSNVPPIIKQYNDLKQKHPDALLLFRCGDFYETYKEDAVKASNILGITLTKHSKRMDEEGKPLKMAGFPYHALDTYLPKLIRAGERVAICDQLESPRQKTSQQEENKPEAKQEVKEVVSAQKEERHGMHR